MSKSYDLTYGYKWLIFFITLAINFIYGVTSVLTDPNTWNITADIDMSRWFDYYIYSPSLYYFLLLLTIGVSLIGGVWLMAAYGRIYSVLSVGKKSKK